MYPCSRFCDGKAFGQRSQRSFCRTPAASAFTRRQGSSISASTTTSVSSSEVGTTSATGVLVWPKLRRHIANLYRLLSFEKLQRSCAHFANADKSRSGRTDEQNRVRNSWISHLNQSGAMPVPGYAFWQSLFGYRRTIP